MKKLFFLLLLCSCQSPSPKQLKEWKGNAMTIDFRILATDGDDEKISRVISDTFAEVHAHYNHFNPQSELSKLNQLPANYKIVVSPGMRELLALSVRAWTLSDHRFDPTIATIQTIWKEALSSGSEPDPLLITPYKEAASWENIHWDDTYFWKDNAFTQLDFGGIAKGYAVDLLYERLTSLGCTHLYIEWGGEIRVSKEHPDERPWRVAIRSSTNQAPHVLLLSDQAVATSGDYEQNWKIITNEGSEKIYNHIIDPLSLKPLQNTSHVHSSTVVAPTCTLADSLAKVGLFFESAEKADAWAQEVQKVEPTVSFYFQ